MPIFANVAWAHHPKLETLPTHSYGHNLGDYLLWDWRLDVCIILLIGSLVYTLGWLRLRRQGHLRLASRKRLVFYQSGLLSITLALISPIDALVDVLFFVHMLQHELLIFLIPPLLLAGQPLLFCLWGLPASLRLKLGGMFAFRHPIRRTLTFLTTPIVAFLVSVFVLWGWHHPIAYNLALKNELAHDLEHVSFFLAFLLYWWPLIGSPPQRSRLLTNVKRGFYLVVSAIQTALLGGLITFANDVLYPHYLTIPRIVNWEVLTDQQFGGAIMWLPGPIIYGLAAFLTMKDE